MSPHSDLAGDVSRAAAADPEANADPEEPPPEDDATWTREFFHEENIMHTLQCLLRSGGRTIEDLCRMCIDASASDVVPALTPEGLMPFSNNYGYVFRYEDMNKKQIRALRTVVETMAAENRVMRCVHENNFYVVPLNKNFIKIKDEVLVFGAASFMSKCLTHTYVSGDGHTITGKLSEFEQERLINDSLFRIINSCKMRRGVLHECMRMLQAHNISF
jgi:hypothetical protein